MQYSRNLRNLGLTWIWDSDAVAQMKIATILTVTPVDHPVPIEVSPTVLAVGTVSPLPFTTYFAAFLANTGLVTSSGDYVGVPITTTEVRVEDSVTPGDKLVKSSDVWHKAP